LIEAGFYQRGNKMNKKQILAKWNNYVAEHKRLKNRAEELRALDPADMTDDQATELRDFVKFVREADAFEEKHWNVIYENDPGKLPGAGQIGGGMDFETNRTAQYHVRHSHQDKGYQSLFEPLAVRTDYRWNDQDVNFYQAVFSGRHHPSLESRGLIEGVGSEGGFLVPSEYSEQIHNVAIENEIVLPLATVFPMTTPDLKIPALAIGDHSSSLFGGFVASRSPEAGTLSENAPTARQVSLQPKKQYGFFRCSREFADDSLAGPDRIAEICGKGLAWYRDLDFLKGGGVGEPLGVLNAPCLIVVAKEGSQAADTITYQNLVDMMSRMYAGSFQNSVWIAHQSTIPQLLTLEVGAGNTHVPVLKESDGKFSILTRPVIFTEKTEVLGDQGDILLADFSQYAIGLREDLRIEFSPHLYFATDEIAARLISRNDACPLWGEALTLEDGSTTVSPFVTLAERAV